MSASELSSLPQALPSIIDHSNMDKLASQVSDHSVSEGEKIRMTENSTFSPQISVTVSPGPVSSSELPDSDIITANADTLRSQLESSLAAATGQFSGVDIIETSPSIFSAPRSFVPYFFGRPDPLQRAYSYQSEYGLPYPLVLNSKPERYVSSPNSTKASQNHQSLSQGFSYGLSQGLSQALPQNFGKQASQSGSTKRSASAKSRPFTAEEIAVLKAHRPELFSKIAGARREVLNGSNSIVLDLVVDGDGVVRPSTFDSNEESDEIDENNLIAFEDRDKRYSDDDDLDNDHSCFDEDAEDDDDMYANEEFQNPNIHHHHSHHPHHYHGSSIHQKYAQNNSANQQSRSHFVQNGGRSAKHQANIDHSMNGTLNQHLARQANAQTKKRNSGSSGSADHGSQAQVSQNGSVKPSKKAIAANLAKSIKAQQQLQYQQNQQQSLSPKSAAREKEENEERQKVKEFWMSLPEEQRNSLIKVEKEAVLRKMKEQQKHTTCSCELCGKRRTAIEQELEMLYDAYYQELERYTEKPGESGGFDFFTSLSLKPFYSSGNSNSAQTSASHSGGRSNRSNQHSNQSQGSILNAADELMKNDGKKFLEMMERLADHRLRRERHDECDYEPEEDYDSNYEDDDDDDEGDDDDDDDVDDEDDPSTEEMRLEEGKHMLQMFAAKMFEQRILAAYREKVTHEQQEKLIAEEEERARLEQQKKESKLKRKERQRAKKKAKQEEEEAEKKKKEKEEEERLRQIRLENERLAREREEKKREEKRREEAERERIRLEQEAKKKAEQERKRAEKAAKAQARLEEQQRIEREQAAEREKLEKERLEKIKMEETLKNAQKLAEAQAKAQNPPSNEGQTPSHTASKKKPTKGPIAVPLEPPKEPPTAMIPKKESKPTPKKELLHPIPGATKTPSQTNSQKDIVGGTPKLPVGGIPAHQQAKATAAKNTSTPEKTASQTKTTPIQPMSQKNSSNTQASANREGKNTTATHHVASTAASVDLPLLPSDAFNSHLPLHQASQTPQSQETYLNGFQNHTSDLNHTWNLPSAVQTLGAPSLLPNRPLSPEDYSPYSSAFSAVNNQPIGLPSFPTANTQPMVPDANRFAPQSAPAYPFGDSLFQADSMSGGMSSALQYPFQVGISTTQTTPPPVSTGLSHLSSYDNVWNNYPSSNDVLFPMSILSNPVGSVYNNPSIPSTNFAHPTGLRDLMSEEDEVVAGKAFPVERPTLQTNNTGFGGQYQNTYPTQQNFSISSHDNMGLNGSQNYGRSGGQGYPPGAHQRSLPPGVSHAPPGLPGPHHSNIGQYSQPSRATSDPMLLPESSDSSNWSNWNSYAGFGASALDDYDSSLTAPQWNTLGMESMGMMSSQPKQQQQQPQQIPGRFPSNNQPSATNNAGTIYQPFNNFLYSPFPK